MAARPKLGFIGIGIMDLKSVKAFAHGVGAALPLIERAVQQYDLYVSRGNEMADAASVSLLYDSRTK